MVGAGKVRLATMRYFSICSGIEAASVAWEPLGWKAIGFSEIEPFPCAVLKHRFPNITNYGDATQHATWPIEPGSIDLLVFGSPCQSFSVAGLRKGLADPRGNLALVILGFADRIKPKWIIWENVPGVLSSNGGKDFGSFLGALGELGYGFAYRVLNAVHFGVPQRRRRVFVVACRGAGGWESAAKVLFEPESLCRDTAKGGKKGKGASSDAHEGFDENGLPRTVGTICADSHPGAYTGQDAYTGRLIPSNAAEVKPIVIDRAAFNQGQNAQYEPHIGESDVMDTIIAKGPHAVGLQMDVRRLTPNECLRLQGFPDNWTKIPWKGKPSEQCPDGPQYKAAGNSMAVPCMSWLGKRIQMVEKNICV